MLTTQKRYQKELAKCRSAFKRVDLHKERGYLMKFTTFSANVENIMPDIPRYEHETMFKELLLQQAFTTFDQKFLSAGDLVELRGDHSMLKKEKSPKIYCTYHLGSYRMLASVLFRQGVDCVLLVGRNMNQSQGKGMAEHIDGLRQKHSLTNLFRIVEAGSASAGLTVLRELKAGHSLIVFVDGSPETAPEPGDESQFLSVRFGQRRLLTRKGVGYLSHASGVPIVPVVSYRQPDLTSVIHCLKSIRPIAKSDREMYCQEAMQQLYDAFWPYLKQYPAQWEGWNFIHCFLEAEKIKGGLCDFRKKSIAFNENRYTLCDLEHAPVLFDRKLYQTFEITDDLRDLLLNLHEVETDSVQDIVGQEVFAELVNMQILY